MPWARFFSFLSLGAFGWLFFQLAQPGQANRREAISPWIYTHDRQLNAQGLREPEPLALPREAVGDGSYRHAISLQTNHAARLLTARRLTLRLSTPLAGTEVLSAWIVSVHDGNEQDAIKFLTDAPSVPAGDGELVFSREDTGAVLRESGVSLKLCIVTRGPDELSLWAARTVPSLSTGVLYIDETTQSVEATAATIRASIQGWFEQDYTGPLFSRAQLLAYSWGFERDDEAVVYILVGLAAALWLCGLAALLRKGSGTGALAAVAGPTCLVAAVLTVYAVITPPFQTPDEPNHVLTFAKVAGVPSLTEQALALANRGHFERLNRNGNEKITARDEGQPLRETSWPDHIKDHADLHQYGLERSALGHILSQMLGVITPNTEAGTLILGLRLFNALFATLCIFAVVAIGQRVAVGLVQNVWLALPVLLVPASAYFATAISNYALLMGGYLLQAGALALLWVALIGEKTTAGTMAWTGALAGTGIALALCAGDNGLSTIGFWGVTLFFVALAAGEFGRNVPRSLAISLSSCLLVFVFLVALLHVEGHSIAPKVMWTLRRSIAGGDVGIFASGLVATFLIAAVFVAAAAIGSWMGRRAGFISLPLSPIGRRCAAVVALLLVGGVILFSFEPLSDIEPAGALPPLGAYISNVLLRFIDGFGPGEPDWFVATSFWGTFGWVDTPLPENLRSILRWGTGIGLILLAMASSRRVAFGGQIVFTAGCFLGVIVSVAIVAAMYHAGPFNVHGRYLLGIYLLTIVLAAEGYRQIFTAYIPRLRQSPIVPAVICLLASLVHGVSWHTILHRYF